MKHNDVVVLILGDDFLVRGKILVDAGQSSFRLFQLSDDAAAEWLYVPFDATGSLARVRPAAAPTLGAAPTIDGTEYARSAAGSGDGEVIGVSGSSGARPVRYETFTSSADGAVFALVLDWGTERQAFAGREVHPNDVEIFGRPSERLN